MKLIPFQEALRYATFWVGVVLAAAPEIYAELPQYEQFIPKTWWPHVMATGGVLVVIAKLWKQFDTPTNQTGASNAKSD